MIIICSALQGNYSFILDLYIDICTQTYIYPYKWRMNKSELGLLSLRYI